MTPVFVDVGAGTGELGVMSVGFMPLMMTMQLFGVVHEKVACQTIPHRGGLG